MPEKGTFGFVRLVNAMKSRLKCKLTLQQGQQCQPLSRNELDNLILWCPLPNYLVSFAKGEHRGVQNERGGGYGMATPPKAALVGL